MIIYYTRPDGAHVKLDHENKKITNVLNLETQKVIGHFEDPAYVDGIIAIVEKFTVSDEATFNAHAQEVKNFLLNL